MLMDKNIKKLFMFHKGNARFYEQIKYTCTGT
jgi:hypothetical protein